jgi:amino acid adenylation domain-containing protein/FkbH-like protein
VRAGGSTSLLKTALAALGKPERERLLEPYLCDRLARSLGIRVAEVDIRRPLGSLGLDSLKAVELQHGLELELGVAMPMVDVLSARDVAELASSIVERMSTASPESTEVPPLPAAVEGRLSRGQEALWFLQQLSPESAAYNVAYAMRLRSHVDPAKLRRTLQVLVNRHSCLRTRFENRNGRPWAAVQEQEEVSFTSVDAASWSDSRLQQFLVEQTHKPFDLERGPLFTAHLLMRADREDVFLISVHHICVDFWSLVVLTDEIGRLYEANDLEAQERQLPLPVSYAEFVRWQDELLASETGRHHEQYWLKQLAGPLPVLNLPTDRPRPPTQTYRGASQGFQLDRHVTRALKDLARQEQVTLYALLVASFHTLLHRYTGDTDVLIGSPVAGRSLAAFGAVVGYFTNMVALRGDLSGDPTFTEILARTRATVLGALAHQDYPFALLVDRLEEHRDPSRSPVFQAAFVLEKPHIREELAEFVLGESGATMSLGGLQVESLALEQRVAQFDVTLMMVEAGGGLAASIQYNADLFEPSTIARLARHFETLVEGIAADPDRRLSELPLLSVEEQHQLLEWKGDFEVASPAVTLQGLFEEQVERTPDAVAVAWDSGQVTYAELNRRVNRLARGLRKLGVGPDVLVGVCMDRSPEMLAAMLGILKAGGAYFPLDPDYPQDRLAFMIRDGQARLVLGKERFAANLPSGAARLVTLDAVLAEASLEGAANPVSWSTAQNLAYVMYTSGSTGTPNGVAVSQQSIIRLVHAPNYVQLTTDDIVLHLAPPTFDAATFEVWASLLHGGRLVLAPYDKPSLEQVGQTLVRHGISTMWLTSGLFHQLVDHDVDVFRSVRQLLAGGDVLSVSHLRTVLARFPSCRLINGYGPTENTTFTCCHAIQLDETKSAASVPIGRPITGTEVFVVDPHQRAVPIGVAGELVTGGIGLARGYLGRPALTAERFVPSMASEDAGARLYRTGDLVRYLESGAIEFLGRHDHQLKIRGFRVELGEIETALTSHPMVRACVVVAQAGPTAKRLIAYLVADSDSTPSTTQLREYLGQRLPDYMVPSVFVTLDAFPLTTNGKVDRRALPSPDQSRPELDNQFVAPKPGTEARLAEIWSELLGLEQVGRHDNFFELGGHSLIGTQVVSRVRQSIGIDLPLRYLFERPTIAGLAEWLEVISQEHQESRDIGPMPVTGDTPPVVSFTQERMWLLEQLILGTPVYIIPAVIRLKGALNVTALEQAVDEIKRRHEVLRTNFRAVDGRPVPIVSAPSPGTAAVAELGALRGDARQPALRTLTKAEALRTFDLAGEPLLRLSLARLRGSDHVLFVTMHHIVSDGWSIGILMRELAALYESFSSGRPSRLTEPAIQYRQYAHWQRRWLHGSKLDAQLAYWRNALSGAPTSIELPLDRARTSPPSYRGSTEVRLLPPQLGEALAAFSKERGVTPFIVMLAALNILLARMTRQNDLVIGTVAASRTAAEIEPLIGCFVNFLPLRTKLSGDESGDTLVRQVRTIVLDATAHQECPFQKIVEAVHPDRSSSQNPLFNVSFQFDNYPQTNSFTETLNASFEPPYRQISQLDLRFVASETRDGTVLSCEYATDLFESTTIQKALDAVCTILQTLVHEPETRLDDFAVPQTLVLSQPEIVAIASTFTAEPVEESVAFWADQLSAPCKTQFAPYGQVFQQLLAADSLLATNQRGLNVVLLRFDDWQSDAHSPSNADSSELQRNVEECGRALRTAAGRSATPWLVCICPSSPATLADPVQRAVYQQMEGLLAAGLEGVAGVTLMGPAQLARAYPVSEYYDRHADQLGHVPYTRELFAAVGTSIVRHLTRIKSTPCKVIVLDCDQTLWKGVCAEDGADGISIGPAYKALQQFMVAQHDAGRLICLCSKNHEADVLEVFDRRVDMPLRREHIVSWRVNWRPKSENLRSLAKELQLGLDSFVFVDDNPVECAEVRANCPEVLSLQLPEAAEQIPAFLHNVWAFDQAQLTSEDTQRTRLYQQNAEREQLREKSLTFAEFIADLRLDVSIDRMSTRQLPRVSQLTQRTNQFNVNKVGRSEGELDAVCRATNTECLTVEVSDRFGDYGLVGVAIAEADKERLNVDTFLLSCRVLGKGVEHRLLARLGEIAAARGLAKVRIPLKPTDRNQPALEFLTSIGSQYRESNGERIDFVIPTQEARNITFQPETATAAAPTEEPASRAIPAANGRWSVCLTEKSARLLDVPAIVSAIDDRKRGRVRSNSALGGAPRTETQRLIAGVWEQLLALDRVGLHEDFFALGGHSLLATQVISRLCDIFRINLPLQAAFDAPTVAELARIVERAKETDAGATLPPVRPTEPRTDLPLSFAQERLWFLDQFEPGSSLFNNPAAVRLRGELNTHALQQAVQTIVNRHQVLRTTFRRDGDRTVQAVVPVECPHVQLVDVRGCPHPALGRLAAEESERPFDLKRGSLIRVSLLYLSNDESVVLFNMHHIVSDGWSAGVLMNEFSTLYDAYVLGDSACLPDLPVQYSDFAVWQRLWLDGPVLDAQLSYWRKQLEGTPPTLDLPIDGVRPAVRTHHGAVISNVVPRALSDRLLRLARQERVTSFMTFLAAFQVLLSRYVGQGDVVVGTTIANRLRPELEGLIGFFANTLALRLDLSDNPSFREALGRVREATLGAYAHQDLPFEKLVEAVQPVRDMSRTPVFQVAFERREEPVSLLPLRGLSVTHEPITAVTAKYDLTLLLLERDGVPARLEIEYNADLFRSSSMARLLEQFEVLLQAIVDDPGRQVSELPLLSAAAEHQLLSSWNRTDVPLPPSPLIHRRFEAQVSAVPDTIAATFEQQQLTYRELNARANQLAGRLRAAGVGPDVLVGIFMERSLEMVVGMLAVLKAGGAYLPLDPGYPAERLRFMLDDSNATVVLAQERLRSQVPTTSATVLSVDAEWSALSHYSEQNVATDVSLENLAYVIYTSGSTGRPKGAMLEHRAIANHMNWMCREFPLGAGDAVLQKTPISFDASVWEFYAPLLAGARLVLARPGGHQDAAYLIDTLARLDVTTLQVVPSLLRLLLERGDINRASCLKRLFCGGEALTVELRDRFFECTDAELHNLYGPTETCIESIAWQCDEDHSRSTVPIGRPIDNTRVYLLDGSQYPTPVGVPGELHIAGQGVGRGYVNRPDLTAERYIPQPFAGQPGARIYKTGDLARYQSDGSVEYLGRRDHQAKVRGFRIELGEIESVLRQHPGVGNAVVLVREDAPGDRRLVAYLEARVALPTQELRRMLQERLPDYMIPSSFVQLEAMPLTANGKVDRRALPAPQLTAGDDTYVAPRNDRETRLAAIFAEVLGIERVGVHDNFFEVGGHSLLATKVVSRIRAAFGTELPLRRVFESPTISELASTLGGEQARSIGTPADMPVLERTSRDGSIPLSFAQQRLWFLDQMEPGNPYYNMPAALLVSGRLQVAALERAFGEIRRRHEVLQARYSLQHGQPVQVLMPHAGVAVHLVDLSSLDELPRSEHVCRLAALDARRPFHLSEGEVLRVTLLKTGETSHTILFAMHHIVSDGWSLSVVVRELSVLYAAFCEGLPSPLDELPVQYVDFAVWQRKWLESDGLRSQLDYWKARLAGALPILDVRTDRPRPEIETFRGADEILLVPRAVSASLNRLSAREHVTLFVTLVAAYKTLLYRHVGEADMIVGTDLAGRNRAELEGLVGFFVNLLVLRTDLGGNPTFRELLARVRETAMGALAHQDVPFDRLVEELRPKRHRSRTPLFQMLFVMENIPLETLRLPGLTMTPMPSQADTARFDLALFVREREDGIVAKWTYKTDLFDRSTIQRLAHQYGALLENITAAPDMRLNDLELRTQADIRAQTLEENRRHEARMSALMPGRRRGHKLPSTSGGATVNGADAEGTLITGNATKQVRTP